MFSFEIFFLLQNLNKSQWTAVLQILSIDYKNTINFTLMVQSKVRSSYRPLAYFSDIIISGKNVVISAEKWQHFCQKWKYRNNTQADNNLNGL